MPPAAKKIPASDSPDTEAIDFGWEDGSAGGSKPPASRPTARSRVHERAYREKMPTITEEDPLRYDLRYDKKRDPTRDSMVTIPDLDPLRHDVDE